jgi:hypothetical protein
MLKQWMKKHRQANETPHSMSFPVTSPPDPAAVLTEPAVRPDGTPISPVFFERQGRIVGPAQPEFFFRDSAGQIGLIVRYEHAPVSIDHKMLRSRRQFETQHPLRSTQTTPNACLSCGSRRRWRSIYGVTICVVCHPPASLELVAEWMKAPCD